MSTMPDGLGTVLLRLARAAVEERLGPPGTPVPPGDAAVQQRLSEPGATFVTLTQDRRLRGCIGSLMAHRALADDVRANAVSAAMRDPRFHPMTASEWPGTDVEVSLLSTPEPIPVASRDEALTGLRPGADGVILTGAGRRGTFLPQVWDQLPTPDEFLSHLVRKAGLPDGWWGDDVRLERYTVTAWHEDDQ